MVLVAVLVMDLVKIQPVMVVQMVRMGAAPGSTAIQNFLARGKELQRENLENLMEHFMPEEVAEVDVR